MKGPPDKVLLKDIVIPAGTVFSHDPNRIGYQCTIGLSDNTHGDVIYYINDDLEVLDTYFTDLK